MRIFNDNFEKPSSTKFSLHHTKNFSRIANANASHFHYLEKENNNANYLLSMHAYNYLHYIKQNNDATHNVSNEKFSLISGLDEMNLPEMLCWQYEYDEILVHQDCQLNF